MGNQPKKITSQNPTDWKSRSLGSFVVYKPNGTDEIGSFIISETDLQPSIYLSEIGTLEETRWSTLRNLAINGKFGNYFNVGDTKTITLSSGEQVVMKVASINDGTGSAGTYYPNNTIDFISVDSLQTKYQVNTTNTNAGGWNNSVIRTTLNSTIFNTLPSDLRSAIVEKIHYRSSGSQSTSLVSASDKLWIPTEYEAFGTIRNSASTEDANYNKKYTIFINDSNRIKKLGTNGSANSWWTSSPAIDDSKWFTLVESSGASGISSASGSAGVPICFRIG